MKIIEVTDEVHAKLIELATEMTTQDPRCTRGPHLFQIQTTENCAAYEGQGEEVWIHPEGEGGSVDEQEEIENYKDSVVNVQKLEDFEEMDEDEKMVYLGFYKVNETTRQKYQNCFFTAKGCQEHIDSNSYHYNEPVNYLNSGWRNPEMELVQEFLCGLVGKKMHR